MARTPRGPRPPARAPRRGPATLAFDALLVEGALIAPAQLARIAAGDAEAQTPADYGVRRGLALRDEIPLAYRVGQALFCELTASPIPSAGATTAFTEALLRDAFGFTGLASHPGMTFATEGGRVPVIVVPPGTGLGPAGPGADRRRWPPHVRRPGHAGSPERRRRRLVGARLQWGAPPACCATTPA